MRRFARNTIVLLIIMIAAVTGLSVPMNQTSADLYTTLPGRTISWPMPVFLVFGILFIATGVCVLLRFLMKTNAKLVGDLLVTVGGVTILVSGAVLIYERVEDSRAAAFSGHTAFALYEQIGQAPIHTARPQLINIVDEERNEDIQDNSPPSPDIYDGHDDPDEPDETDEPDEQYEYNEYDILKYIVIDGINYIGLLSIPSLGIELPVNSNWSYPALRLTPCRYSGSIENDSLVIAAHNYSSHFGGIERLSDGDIITLTDVEGVNHTYETAYSEVLQPTSVDEVVNSKFDLVLFTCTSGGDERIVVRCIRTA